MLQLFWIYIPLARLYIYIYIYIPQSTYICIYICICVFFSVCQNICMFFVCFLPYLSIAFLPGKFVLGFICCWPVWINSKIKLLYQHSFWLAQCCRSLYFGDDFHSFFYILNRSECKYIKMGLIRSRFWKWQVKTDDAAKESSKGKNYNFAK